MGCDLMQLQAIITTNEATIAALRAENCGDQDDVGACLKRRAAAIAAAEKAIRDAEIEIQACSLLTGVWWIEAFNPDGSRLPAASGTLLITSWDVHTSRFDGDLTLPDHQYTIFEATFNPYGSHLAFVQNTFTDGSGSEGTGFLYDGTITQKAGQQPLVLDGNLGFPYASTDPGSWRAWKGPLTVPPWVFLSQKPGTRPR